jgi:hypothetical protein
LDDFVAVLSDDGMAAGENQQQAKLKATSDDPHRARAFSPLRKSCEDSNSHAFWNRDLDSYVVKESRRARFQTSRKGAKTQRLGSKTLRLRAFA